MADHISKRYLEKLKVLLSSVTEERGAVAEEAEERKEEEGVEQTDHDTSVWCTCVCVYMCIVSCLSVHTCVCLFASEDALCTLLSCRE